MSDLKKYISKHQQRDATFADNFDNGYQSFKIGVLLRQAREAAGITQETIAERLLCDFKGKPTRASNKVVKKANSKKLKKSHAVCYNWA
ncbi:MAG: hypothetical protein QJT81_19055 [Candidatus Thiothrix putei]|uniref:HTH cro/C1-type domain-containing protein n=1 Tax=Candidatus Thiothrix putei TaxID=3080811 RepID=A0AA95HAX6_9GAMM|nr:MAG: hypothetical protein QJT81_19055 [Candidatus Thiothrix putei]